MRMGGGIGMVKASADREGEKTEVIGGGMSIRRVLYVKRCERRSMDPSEGFSFSRRGSRMRGGRDRHSRY